MKILYLHGLDGSLRPEKRKSLEKYAEIYGPQLCYRTNNRIVEFLYGKYLDKNIDFVMGSSMGGYAGYFLSFMLEKPGLFFNPALPYKNVSQFLPRIELKYDKFRKIVIGKQDETIKAKDNLNFLMNTLPENANVKISILNRLAHQIPYKIFEKELDIFFYEFPNNC